MFSLKPLALFLIALALASNVYGAPPETFRQNLDRFVAEALQNNPQLKEAEENISLFKQIPSQAGSLDDPTMKFEFMNVPIDSFSFTDQPMTQKQLTISQKFPYPGKLGLRTEMANQDVVVARENLEELKLQAIRDVKVSYFELCFVLASIEITQQNKKLLEQFVSIAETKYSVGKGIQQDVLKAQVELSKNIDELIRLQKRKGVEEARLNTLMNRLPQAPLSIRHGITETPFQFTSEKLQAEAEDHRPILKELKALIEKSKISKTLALKEYYPDFNVGVKYGRREELLRQTNPDFVSAFVSVNIPLWHKTKQSKKVRQERFRIDRTKAAYNKIRNEIFLRLEEKLDEQKKASELVRLIKTGIIPQARQSLESAMAGYSVDKVDFLTLLDNQVTLFQWKIKHHRELTGHEKTLAKIEYLVGEKLF